MPAAAQSSALPIYLSTATITERIRACSTDEALPKPHTMPKHIDDEGTDIHDARVR
jgi:hypothetical protein